MLRLGGVAPIERTGNNSVGGLCDIGIGAVGILGRGLRRRSRQGCGYMLQTAGGTATEFIRVVDAAAPGTRGTFAFKGTDANHTSHATLNNKGLILISFPVIHPGSESMSVMLATKPATTGTFHFVLRPAASDAAAKNGCSPK